MTDSQILRPPLDMTPPIWVKRSRAFCEVNLLRRERSLELVLLINISRVAMEGSTGELRGCILKNLDRALAIVPVMFVGNDLRVAKSVAVHQGPQRLSDVRLLSGGEFTGGIRGITVPGLILNPNCVGGDPLVPEPL